LSTGVFHGVSKCVAAQKNDPARDSVPGRVDFANAA
jgi:hypothetical protein